MSRTETFDLSAIAYARWKRAVDLLVREVVRRRVNRLEAAETARAEKRVRNLRRIVRKALSEYTRAQTLSGPQRGPTEGGGKVSPDSSPR